MKYPLSHKLLYLPAFVFWIGFVLLWKLAHKFVPNEEYSEWCWMGVEAINFNDLDKTKIL